MSMALPLKHIPQLRYTIPVFVRLFSTIFETAAAAAAAAGTPSVSGAPAAVAAAAKIENSQGRRQMLKLKFEEGEASGWTSVSTSIGCPFRPRLDVRFDLDLTFVSTSI